MSRSNLRRSTLLALITVAAMAGVILRPSPGKTEAPAGRYTIPGDGTVYDTATTLTWQRAANMTGMTWASAGPYCAGLTSPAGGGWRLPTVKELTTFARLLSPWFAVHRPRRVSGGSRAKLFERSQRILVFHLARGDVGRADRGRVARLLRLGRHPAEPLERGRRSPLCSALKKECACMRLEGPAHREWSGVACVGSIS